MASLRRPAWLPVDLNRPLRALPNLIEEVYEALDAMESGNRADLAEELGDLRCRLFSAQIAAEEGNLQPCGCGAGHLTSWSGGIPIFWRCQSARLQDVLVQLGCHQEN